MQQAVQDSLDNWMQLSPISVDTKCEILNNLWNLDLNPQKFYASDLDYDIYFAYYTEQCSDALHDGGRQILLRTHRDIIDIANYIKTSTSRENIAQILNLKLPVPLPPNHEELVDASIGLTIRLLLMMNFGSLQYGFTGRGKLSWTKESLGKNMDEYLGASRSSSSGQERVRLERAFNAFNLERIAGLKIEWTMNLADHLQLIDEENKVSIFCYASFLECQLKSTIFPEGFIAETLRTIRLLIPQTEKQTKQWFKKKCLSAPHLDHKVLKCGRLSAENRQIEDFEFWRERIVILKQCFDEAEPNTISQWWCDRRKRVQWYTFWVAILVLSLTIFLGLIQCIEGALQVYKAFND